MMPYILSPRWARLVQRGLFVARYLLLGAAGMLGILNGNPAFAIIGWTLIVAAFVALIGVSTGRFQFELVALWFLIGALLWSCGLIVESGRPTSAILIGALVPALSERLLHLLLVARRARGVPNNPGDSRHGGQ